PDVDDHAGGRFDDGEPRADAGGHGLLDEEDLAGAGTLGGVEHGALLDGGDAGGDGDDDAGAVEAGLAVHLADEVGEHRLGDLEVGDHAVLEGADGGDGAGGLAQHLLGHPAHGVAVGEDLVGALPDGDHGGLVQDDALAPDRNQGVAG